MLEVEHVVTVNWSGEIEDRALVSSMFKRKPIHQYLSMDQRFCHGKRKRSRWIAKLDPTGTYFKLLRMVE